MNQFTGKDHTFVVCAYKESEYLEQSIQSALSQNIKGEVILSTSTPNDFIKGIAEKYHLPLYVNKGRKSIADDWNFGYAQAKTPLITLCHQDDVYKPNYVEQALDALNHAKQPLIFFSDYHELRNGVEVFSNKLLKIKRMLLLPMRSNLGQNSKWIRRRVLSMGCPICCPSVTFVKKSLPNPVFQYGYKSNVDWQAWERLSSLDGEFVYLNKPLMLHRIHTDSETSHVLGDNIREKEDYEMFTKFWPVFIARLLTKFYVSSQNSNEL